MKKFGKLFSILFVVVLMTTGCVKYEIGMEVGSDKSFTLEMIAGFSSSLMEMGDSTETSSIDEEDKKAYEEAGFTVEDYSDDEYVGSKISKKYDSIDLVSSSDCGTVDLVSLFGESDEEDSEEETEIEDPIFFKKSSSLLSTTYTATFTVDLTSDSTSDDYSAYSSMFDFNYHITLPVKADSNNATSVSEDGLTYTWDLEYGKLNEINYSFTMYKINPAIIIGVVVGIVLVIVVVIIVTKKGKKNPNQPVANNNNNNNNVGGGMPVPNMDTNNANNPVAMNNNFAANDMPGMMQPNSPQQFNDPNIGNTNSESFVSNDVINEPVVNTQPEVPSFTASVPEAENTVSLEHQPPIIPVNNENTQIDPNNNNQGNV